MNKHYPYDYYQDHYNYYSEEFLCILKSSFSHLYSSEYSQ